MLGLWLAASTRKCSQPLRGRGERGGPWRLRDRVRGQTPGIPVEARGNPWFPEVTQTSGYDMMDGQGEVTSSTGADHQGGPVALEGADPSPIAVARCARRHVPSVG